MSQDADRPGSQRSWWSRIQTLAGALALAGAALVCSLLGFWQAFSRFKEWDDEGYFLQALRRFQEHGGLYEEIRHVFYGPFYFEAIAWGSSLLHIPLDSATARWLMLCGWMVALAASAFTAWRLCGSRLAAAVTVMLGFQFLFLVTNEPLHATSPVLILLALLLLLCFRSGVERAPGRGTMAACGALCAAIALVKLNVGLFVVAAFVCAHPPGGHGRAAQLARRALALGLVLLPFALMRVLLDTDWVRDYALFLSAALLPFACLLLRSPGQPVERKAWQAFTAAGAGFSALSIGACLANGTTLAGMWRSLVLDALSFPLTTHNSPTLPGHGQMLLGLLVLPVGWALRRRPFALKLLQLAAGLWIAYDCLRLESAFAALPFLWLFSLGGVSSARRTFVGLLAVLLSLQAFPQPGSQRGLFSLFVPLVGVTGACRAWQGLAWPESFARLARLIVPPLAGIAACLLLALRGPVFRSWPEIRAHWTRLPPLDLPGTGALHLPEMDVARQTWLALNLKLNADTFVGLPGVPSAHLWSGVPAPVPFYPHHWVLYYDLGQEEALLQALLASKRPCIVRHVNMLPIWTGSRTFREGPFTRALGDDFELAGVAGHYELWFPRAANPELVLSGFPVELDPQLLERFGQRIAFRLRFPVDGGYLVSHLALHNAVADIDVFDTASATEAERIIALTPAGAEILRGSSAEPLDPRRMPEMLLLLPQSKSEHGTPEPLFRAYGPDGRVVARLLLQPAR